MQREIAMRLRQVALVAENLTATRHQIFQLLGLEQDYIDPGVAEFGLGNSVMCIGDTFLEIVSPIAENTTAGRLLERRQGDGGYMVLVQVPELDSYNERTRQLKVRKIWEVELKDTRAFHLHPKDMGGAIVSIDEMTPPESWRWGGPNWSSQGASFVSAISAVDLQAQDPENMARQWAKVFDEEVTNSGAEWQIVLEQSQINFGPVSDGRGEGVSAIEFIVSDRSGINNAARELGLNWEGEELYLCGTRFRFRN